MFVVVFFALETQAWFVFFVCWKKQRIRRKFDSLLQPQNRFLLSKYLGFFRQKRYVLEVFHQFDLATLLAM